MGPGSTLQLAPKILVSTGETLSPTSTVSYRSRVPATISVDGTGRVTVLATSGSSTIYGSTSFRGQVLEDSLAISVLCTLELTLRWSPADSTIAVGERFTPALSLTTCSGYVTLTDTFAWLSIDPSIATVNPVHGEITGVRAGTTTVRASGLTWHVGAQIVVTVH